MTSLIPKKNQLTTFAEDSITIHSAENAVQLNTARGRSETVLSVVVDGCGNDVTDGHRRRSPRSSSNGSAKLVSSVYLIVLTMLGLLMPLQDAVSHTWLTTIPYIVFLLYLPIVSTVFLVFVQCHMQRQNGSHCHKSSCNTCPPLMSIFCCPNREPPQHATSTVTVETNAESVGTSVSPAYVRKYNTSSCTQQQQDDRITSTVAIIARRANVNSSTSTDQHPLPVNLLSQESACGISHTSSFEGDAASLMSAQCVDDYSNDVVGNDDEQSAFWMDLDKLGNLFSHQGSSFYLRLGALAFGIGNVIYLALEIENWISPKVECQGSQLFGWTFIFRLIFIVVQTFIVFKNTKIQIVKFQGLAHFGFKHVIATNLCLWLHTLIREVVEELEHSKASPLDERNDTSNTSISTQQTVVKASCNLDPQLLAVSRYLFPFVLEYSLIAIGAMTCIIFTGIGPTRDSHGQSQVARGFKNLIRVFSYKNKLRQQNIDPQIGVEDTQSPQHGDDQEILLKSHSGMFIGILLLAGVITSIVLFYFANGDHDFVRSGLIYWITDVVLQGCLFLGCCLALVLTRNMAFVDRPISPDDFLLFLSMVGSIMFEMSIFIVFINSDSSDVVRALGLTSSSLGVCQTFLQTIVIMHAMRRYPTTANDVIRMPGRGTFTFLIIGNLAAWIQRTMQIKELGHGDWEGSIVWVLLLNISLPLLLFYRFHSSVCFADVWHVAYTPLQHDVTAATSKNISPQTHLRRAASSVSLSRLQHQQSPCVIDGFRPTTSLEVPRIIVTEPVSTMQCDDVMSVQPTSTSSAS